MLFVCIFITKRRLCTSYRDSCIVVRKQQNLLKFIFMALLACETHQFKFSAKILRMSIIIFQQRSYEFENKSLWKWLCIYIKKECYFNKRQYFIAKAIQLQL